MNKLTSAIRHRDSKYWVPSEGLNDASSGNCRIVILVPNECLKDSSSGKCRIIMRVPNECLKDSSSGKCGIIMPQSGVGATPHTWLKFKVRNEYTPQSDVCATSHKGLISQLINAIAWRHNLSQVWDTK